jgi:hypothetical protein
MSILLRQLFRYAAQKAASDPQVRDKAIKVAGNVVTQAKRIAKENDRARAAGRAFRQGLNKLRNPRNPGD